MILFGIGCYLFGVLIGWLVWSEKGEAIIQVLQPSYRSRGQRPEGE